MKDQLIFDTTDANTIADSDSVGAYVRSSDGTLITHTTVGGKEALDVRVAEGINVEVDLNAADDSVASWLNDGSGNALSSTGGALDVNLTNANIEVTQGTSPWVIGDGGGSITVDASQLDIDDLNATDDAVQAWAHDGSGTALTSTLNGGKQSLDVHISGSDPLTVNDAALANSGIANASNTLSSADTAQDVVSSPLTDRKYLWVYNLDNQKIYIGGTGVSASDGFPLSPSAYLMMRAGASVDVEFVGSSGKTPEIRTLELS